MLITTATLARETLVSRVRDIAAQPHPMSDEIQGEAVLLEGQLDRFAGDTVGEMRMSAEQLSMAEVSNSNFYRNVSRVSGAAALASATACMAGMVAGNSPLMIAGAVSFFTAGAAAVVYDHTSALYADAAQHTGASVARLDRWAGFVAGQS